MFTHYSQMHLAAICRVGIIKSCQRQYYATPDALTVQTHTTYINYTTLIGHWEVIEYHLHIDKLCNCVKFRLVP